MGLSYRSEVYFTINMAGSMGNTGRHGNGEVTEGSISGSARSRKREGDTGPGWTLNIQPILQQGHTYSKATPPKPCQIAPHPNEQASTSMSLWESFLFKPPHDQTQLGKEKIWFIYLESQLIEGSQGRNSNKVVQLTDLFIMACSAYFLTEPRTTAQGRHHPQ